MSLLDDFSSPGSLKTGRYVNLKTVTVLRLKNALVNLGNSRTGKILIARAKAGKLEQSNVLLRPAECRKALEKLVIATTSTAINKEVEKCGNAAEQSAAGWIMLLISDEGKIPRGERPRVNEQTEETTPLAHCSPAEALNMPLHPV